MAIVPDRIDELKAQTAVTGIDFIYIHPDQKVLNIYFLTDPEALTDPEGQADPLSNNPGDVMIYCPSRAVGPVAVDSVVITNIAGTNVLRVKTGQPGDFVLYNVRIDDRRIDPYYNDVPFNFKANCPSDLDCKPAEPECPPEDLVDFPIDYSARDFWSFRRALLEFASQKYPDWPDRLAADAGVMLAEVMSAMGDEMAYYQDRIAREAYLETATQRRSLRKHARLVDYDIHDGLGAFAWIDVSVDEVSFGDIPAGTNIWAVGENGIRVDFEIGNNLEEAGKNYLVSGNCTQLEVHRWDEDQVCLPVGSTELDISGHHAADLITFDGLAPGPENGKWVLLKTNPANPSQPARTWMVRLISATDTTDPVLLDPDSNLLLPITHLVWDDAQATPYELDMTVLVVRGNMVPSTSGKTFGQYFITGADLAELTPVEQESLEALAGQENQPIYRAIERAGNNNSIAYLCTLDFSDSQNLVWLNRKTGVSRPEIQLSELQFNSPVWGTKTGWRCRQSLLGVNSSGSQDRDFTLDDGTWRRVVGYWRNGQEIVHEDYASGEGKTIRFGDGEFGLVPAEKSVFKVLYRLGAGRSRNVAPEVITNFDRASLPFIESLTNPLNATGGQDPQSANEIRQSAPAAFRTITYRAVRPEDYAEAAERLPWVQKAGAAFRWTGSWLTAFVTPDPKYAVRLTDPWRGELLGQLNRFRQAGREAFTMDPHYADLDLEIKVCVKPDSYPGDVRERILIRLFGKKGVNPVKGFFAPDRYTFGGFLERSALEAEIQLVPGVKAVEQINYRRRGVFDWQPFSDYFYDPGPSDIIRIENDSLHPERGILKLKLHGGA